MAGERIAGQGLPARICWVGLGHRHWLGLAFRWTAQWRAQRHSIVIGHAITLAGSSGLAEPQRPKR